MEPAPPRLNLLVIRSADLERAMRFYAALGFSFVAEQHGNGPSHYAAANDEFVLEIYPLQPGELSTPRIRIGFAVDSVDETTVNLVALGATCVKAAHDSAWGRRAVMHDFDGNAVELLQRRT